MTEILVSCASPDRARFRSAFSVIACLMLAAPLMADSVPVRQIEGLVRGFLVLRDMDDTLLATGDLSDVHPSNLM